MSPWSSWIKQLEIGARRPLLVRRETLTHLGVGRRILFASDLHLRKTASRHIVDGMLEIVSRERPDVILLGGDLVDWSTALETLREFVSDMTTIAPVAAIAGNHDRWIGQSRVRKAVIDGGGHWLADSPLRWAPDAVAYGTTEQPRLPGQCQVLCAHHPPAAAVRHGFDLILSGHLHGGQFVFFERGGRLYPGAFLYRWNGLRFHENGSTLVVSRGVRDTLPLRWNCPREVILVEV
jgi:uncharacterized protein